MIPEIGNFALILALSLAILQGTLPLAGAWRGNHSWMAVARPAAFGQALFILLAFGCLTYSFLTNDFSVAYVAENSNTALPAIYKFTAVWGGHEGSILLWVAILSVWGVAVAIFSRSLPQPFAVRVLAVMGLIGVGFLLFILMNSDPFTRLFPAPLQGRDLNPLLQDPGMVGHPPMLYFGYVGFAVAFAFSIAALLGGRLDSAWARWSRPWTTAAWVFLTCGITLGSAWSYYVLGWGGWWFWDPVENASFMPWLVGTALIHSLAVTEKRSTFKAWTALLSIAAFSLSLLGTFIVRSGVLTSVHAFAVSPARGIYILSFLGVVIGASLILYAIRGPAIRSVGNFTLISRESLLLANNVLLAVTALAVLLGTLYPLVVEALGLGRLSVGPPYFDAVFVPIMLLLAFLTGIGPAASWRRAETGALARQLRNSFIIAIAATAIAVITLAGVKSLMLVLTLFLAFWVIATSARGIYKRLSNRGGLRSWRSIPRGFYGMHIAHIGVAVFMLGVGVVGTFAVKQTVRLGAGDSATVAGYDFHLDKVKDVSGPNFTGKEGMFTVSRDGKKLYQMDAQKRTYQPNNTPRSMAAIQPGFTRDLFIAMGQELDDGTWTIRVRYMPLVRWIWGGALMMAFGGVLAFTDRRYRLALQNARIRLPEGASAGVGS